MKKIKLINTPKVLSEERAGSNPYSPMYVAIPSVQGKRLSPIESISKKEREEEMIYSQKELPEEGNFDKKVLSSVKSSPEETPNEAIAPAAITSTSYSSESKRFKTEPSSFNVTETMYRSKMKKIYRIVLHHTAGHMLNDKGKQDIKTWNGNGLGSHTVIETDGHIEYVIPVPYGANTQGHNLWVKGKKKAPKCVNFNNNSVATELINYGYLNKSFKDTDGKTYWYRGSKKTKFEAESETSAPHDFQGNPIKSYKGHKRCVEYTTPQLNAMCNWIKKMQTFIANNYPSSNSILDWKFTQATYNQMFPNITGKNLPKDWKSNGGEIIQGEYLIAGIANKSQTKNSNPYGWAVSKDCFENVIGIYTHNSISNGKSDVFPTKKMIETLKKHFG